MNFTQVGDKENKQPVKKIIHLLVHPLFLLVHPLFLLVHPLFLLVHPLFLLVHPLFLLIGLSKNGIKFMLISILNLKKKPI